MRTLVAAIIVACLLCSASHPQEKSQTGRLLEKCTKVLKYGQLNEFAKPMKQDAVIALGMAGDERALPILLEYLQNEKDEQLQFQIIRALGWIKSDKAVAALEKFLQHQDRSRRNAAMFALEAITGKDYGSKEQSQRPMEEIIPDLFRNLEAGGLTGKKDSPGVPPLEVGKAYRFVFSRAEAKDVVAALVERPRDGWAKVRQRPGEAESWIHLTAVAIIAPAADKKDD